MSTATDAHDGAGSGMPASLPRDNLYRATSDITLIRSEDGAAPVMRGHFAVWNQWTVIRSHYENRGRPFLERFAPGSMTKTLTERTPKVLFNHGKDPQIGQKPLGHPTRMEPDEIGAYYEVPLLDTSYNRDLLPGLEAGLYGASHQFSILHEDFHDKPARSEHNPSRMPERTVHEARVVEFGPVTFPAYEGATAGMRSLTDQFTLPVPGYAPSGVSLAGVGSPELWVRLGGTTTTTDSTTHFVPIPHSSGVFGIKPGTDVQDIRADGPESNETEARHEPEPEETTPPAEPEPEATTHSNRGLFWFVATPAHLKE